MQYREHLKSLRQWMDTHRVNALLVPHEDMFGGEYLAPHDERLAWASGFTGSAGLAIIAPTEAHLFVDGRYTLQAKSQSPDFIIHDFTKTAIDEICNALPSLHYDPWLLSVQQLEEWKKRITMCVLDKNPIDALWQDRPMPLHKSAFLHPIEYAGISAEEKLRSIRENLAKYRADAWFSSNSESVCWLLNIRGQDLPYTPLLHCMALITDTEVTLFCEPEKISQEILKELPLNTVSIKKMPQVLESFEGKICADKRATPAALADISFNWKTDPCELKKAIKNSIEQKGMRHCHARDATALIHFWIWLEQQRSVTEIEAQDYLETCRQQIDLYKGDSFATISGFGPHGAVVHYRSTPETNIPITEGMYLLDSGGQYLDGTTDITRTFYTGSKPTQQQKEHYTLVLKGHIALANIRFPKGTAGAQLDSLARQFLWRQGLDYAHGTGHGVGSYLNVHEGPQGISKVRHTPLEIGMVVSNEPGLYIENQYGIRIENLQMVKQSEHPNFLCFESLTLVPYEPKLIEHSLLTKEEIYWLVSYYKNIWEKVSPMLAQNEQKWLKEKLNIN